MPATPFKAILSLGALVLLTGYFFDGVSLATRPPEPLTWEEFSANPKAVEHFRLTAEVNGAPIGQKNADLKKAYLRSYEAQVAVCKRFDEEHPTTKMSLLKRSWHTVYRFCYPVLHPSKTGTAHVVPDLARERVGMFIVLFVLCVSTGVVRSMLRRIDEEVRV